jgi:sugar-specific transcriptional regulator TrmB
MGEESIKQMLKDFGLTDTEAELYLYLSRHGALKGTEIAKQVKKDKAQVYHVLRSIQAKGLVELTLEAPVRFIPVPFENVMESAISAKRAEAECIESTKKELLRYWKDIDKGKSEILSERFTVIEGRGHIHPRLKQMVENTKSQLSIISTVASLLRTDRFGLLNSAFVHAANTNVKFRFITELSKDNIRSVKALIEGAPKRKGFEGRIAELGLGSISRMLIRDNSEVAFFIGKVSDKNEQDTEDLCLWTNCNSIVNSFKAVFDDLWNTSVDIQDKIAEIETGKPLPRTCVFANAEAAREKYIERIQSASKEVISLTSSKGLSRIAEQKDLLSGWVKKHVKVRIMAPITANNFEALRKLSQFCEIKHITDGYLDTTIIDEIDLFQFKKTQARTKQQSLEYFKHAFYSNDSDYVDKTRNMLDALWRNARSQPALSFESVATPFKDNLDILPENHPTRRYLGVKVVEIKRLSEKVVLDKIIHGKKLEARNPATDIHRIYATGGSAIIHPPSYLNLPDLLFDIAQIDNQSSVGACNVLHVYQWLNMGEKTGYAPVAMIMTNATAFPVEKNMYKNTPAGDNCHLVKEDELQIRVHGNSIFTGWTFPIPLLPRNCVLPPSCLMLEGFGKVHPVGYTMLSGFGRQIIEQNLFEAFVTFMHPRSKYSGPGTDGFFVRDYIATLQPPA